MTCDSSNTVTSPRQNSSSPDGVEGGETLLDGVGRPRRRRLAMRVTDTHFDCRGVACTVEHEN